MSSVKIIKSAVFLKPRVCPACNIPSASYSLPLSEVTAADLVECYECCLAECKNPWSWTSFHLIQPVLAVDYQ
ncbi:hypothetical protein D5086_030736 [Populus alba]|uniref:Uncharacterized protein n=1 Tax=Populus alba TaxID=43335 RepID=A0ACC4APL6_POPAL